MSSALSKFGILTSVSTIRCNSKTFWVCKHIFQQLTARRSGACICKLNSLLHHLIYLLLYRLQFRFTGQLVLKYVFLQGCDGISCSITSLLSCQYEPTTYLRLRNIYHLLRRKKWYILTLQVEPELTIIFSGPVVHKEKVKESFLLYTHFLIFI